MGTTVEQCLRRVTLLINGSVEATCRFLRLLTWTLLKMWGSDIRWIQLTEFEMLPKLLGILLTDQEGLGQTGLCRGVFLLDKGISLVVIVVEGTSLRRRM